MPRPTFRAALTAALAGLIPLAASGASEPPFSFDAAYGRLPKDVVPLDYTIAIVPNAATDTLRGTERVVLQVRKPTRRIVFNTLNQTLANVRFDGAPVSRVETKNDAQLTTLTLARPAAAGRHVLTLAYTGKIESSAQGLFDQPFQGADGAQHKLLSTQFESTDARRMFPSWDEPAFRATYALSVTLPAAWRTVSNMPIVSRVAHGATATTTFGRTPRMASYLVELTAGDIASLDATSGGTAFSVWAPAGQEQTGRYALGNAQQILAYYNDYFGIAYPLPKLASIAIPGGFGGAMENWGAITYNENILLLPPSATTGQKQGVYSVQAHEMAHQWFGDLVTMAWWDDLWLNESFASWMAAKATDHFNPDWNWWRHEDQAKESAMGADASPGSHAIQQHVVNELQAGAAFDPEITYDKGQAFLRMLEAYLGEATFRSGIQRYMAAHKYSNATTTDLWNALGAAGGKPVAQIAGAWIDQPGFPLVSVASSCDAAGNRTIALSQRRFVSGGTDAQHRHWSVPMQIASGSGAPQPVLLTTDGQTVPAGRCGESLRANAGAVGFYRVAYDAATFAANQKAFASLPTDDKIALLDDQWALVRNGDAPLSSYLALASNVGTERDDVVWRRITAALASLERDARGTKNHDAVAAYARRVVKPLATELGWDPKPEESVGTQALRRDVLGDLGHWGDPDVIAEARTRFARYATDPSSLTPDAQGTVFGIVGTNADAATWDRLHQLAVADMQKSDFLTAQRLYFSLTEVKDPALAERTLAIASSKEIPPQMAGQAVRLVGAVGNWNPKPSWAFFKAHSDQLLAPMSDYERSLAIPFIIQGYWSAAPADELQAWASSKTPPDAQPYVQRAIERVRDSVAVAERLNAQSDTLVAGGNLQPAK